MKKIFTFFAALLVAGNMLAANLNLAYAAAVLDQEINNWLFLLYETKPETIYDESFPYVYIQVPAHSQTAIAGTYIADQSNVEYDVSEEEFIYASEVSDLVITYIEKGRYHYSFTFTDTNGEEYVIDQDLPTEARTNGYVVDIDLTDAIEDIHVDGKTVKTIVNGQLILERNGKAFNALGTEIK